MTLTRDTLSTAMRQLASVCDGAVHQDGQGFSAVDVWIGHYLANKTPDLWTDIDTRTAMQLAVHYRHQLSGLMNLPEGNLTEFRRTSDWATTREAARQAREAAREALAEKRHQQQPRHLRLEGDTLTLEYPYEADVVAALKNIPTRKYIGDGLTTFHLSQLGLLLDLLHDKDVTVHFDPLGVLIPPPKPDRYAELEGQQIRLFFPYRADVLPTLRKLKGTFSRDPEPHWTVKVTHDILGLLDTLNIPSPEGLQEVLQALHEQQQQALHAKAEFARTAKQSAGESLHIEGLKTPLLPHQFTPIHFALKTRRLINADAPGLGKTLTTLATLLALKPHAKAVVVCPPNLIPNWIDEVNMHLTTPPVIHVCQGTKPKAIPGTAQVVLCGWSVLHHWLKTLTGFQADLVAVDEGHYGKERTTLRGKAFMELGRAYAEAVKLSLTGTAIVNRPRELLPHLEFLGITEQFGGGWKFLERYCDAKQLDIGSRTVWDLDGASNLDELHQKLLESGSYVRRNKAMLVEQGVLPKKYENGVYAYAEEPRHPTYLHLNGHVLHEYRKVEKGFTDYLDEKLIELEDQGYRGEKALKQLIKEDKNILAFINQLRMTIGRLKVPYVQQIVHALVEKGEKVVVFAHHREVVDQYAEQFTGLKLQGAMSSEDISTAKRLFNRSPLPEHPVMAVSIEAGKTGHTLCEQARHGAGPTCRFGIFAEENWTYGDFEQASDRIYRIGQNQETYIFSLTVKDTIDEYLFALRERKRGVVGAVLDGLDWNDDEASMALEIARKYISR